MLCELFKNLPDSGCNSTNRFSNPLFNRLVLVAFILSAFIRKPYDNLTHYLNDYSTNPALSDVITTVTDVGKTISQLLEKRSVSRYFR